MFVADNRVPVTDERGNTVYIRAKMDFGTRNKVIGAVARVHPNGEGAETEMDLGAYNTALLTQNILAWEGPDFNGVPCTAANIARLDPDEPLVDQVLAEINTRNTKAANEPSPKSSTNGGGNGLPISESQALALAGTPI